MCIRDSHNKDIYAYAPVEENRVIPAGRWVGRRGRERLGPCLLYTSDAADERSSVDLGGRRIIKKKTILMTTRQINIQN